MAYQTVLDVFFRLDHIAGALIIGRTFAKSPEEISELVCWRPLAPALSVDFMREKTLGDPQPKWRPAFNLGANSTHQA
jgi:hypothetical protein